MDLDDSVAHVVVVFVVLVVTPYHTTRAGIHSHFLMLQARESMHRASMPCGHERVPAVELNAHSESVLPNRRAVLTSLCYVSGCLSS
jgi:hypothetical protein